MKALLRQHLPQDPDSADPESRRLRWVIWPYMYHCHILRHEDSGMMGQFVIVEPGTEDSVPRTLATAGHGADHGS